MLLDSLRSMCVFTPSCVDRRNVTGDILRGLKLLERARGASAGVAGAVLTDSLCGFDGSQGME